MSSGYRLTLSYNLYSAPQPPAAKAGGKRKAGEERGLPTTSASLAAAAHAPQLSAERDAPGAVGALRTLLADPAWHAEGAKLGVILGHKCAEGGHRECRGDGDQALLPVQCAACYAGWSAAKPSSIR